MTLQAQARTGESSRDPEIRLETTPKARWMDPNAGTFLSIDPLVGNAFDPQAVNAYSYARNNPVSYTDPMGTCPNECYYGRYTPGQSSVAPGMSSWLQSQDSTSFSATYATGDGGLSSVAVSRSEADSIRRSNGEHLIGIEAADPIGPNAGNFIKFGFGIDLVTPLGGFEANFGGFVGRTRSGELQAGPYVEAGPAIGAGLSLDVGGEFIGNVDGLDGSHSINFVEGIGPGNAEVNVNPNPPNSGDRFVGDFVNGFGGARSFGPLPAEAFISATQTRAFNALGFMRNLGKRVFGP